MSAGSSNTLAALLPLPGPGGPDERAHTNTTKKIDLGATLAAAARGAVDGESAGASRHRRGEAMHET
jgi:hypothetical protein